MSLIRSLIQPLRRNVRDAVLLCGIRPKLTEQDRIVLEETIFPYLVGRDDLRRVLFVGCRWYTWYYNKVFAGKDYWTLEIDPAARRYGSKQHVVDSVENVAEYFEPGSLDAVLLLGVIGWGLDDPDAADRAVAGIHRCLSPGGVFINGWDDVPEHRPFDIPALPALGGFEAWSFPPFDAPRLVCEEQDTRHTFDFYIARGASDTAPA
ncbi:MAG: methyltransferase domain-containing protein [Planctomycetota bacterium]